MRALALIAVSLVMLFVGGLVLAEDERVPVQAQALCSKDGKLLAVRIFAPFAGTITVPIPPDACAPQKAPARPASRPPRA
jgi:hypothetical protein